VTKPAFRARVFVMLPIALALVACEPPEEEIEAAQTAFEEARASEAATYAPTKWALAQRTLDAATLEVETQTEKPRVARRYEEAIELLAEAAKQARAARSEATDEIAQLQSERSAALDSAGSGFDAARTVLASLDACQRRPKGFSRDLEVLDGQAEAIEVELLSVQGTFDGEDLYVAVEAANAIQERIDALSTDLMSVKEKSGC